MAELTEVTMKRQTLNIRHEKVRMSISIPIETKKKLRQITHSQGKRMSDFIRS